MSCFPVGNFFFFLTLICEQSAFVSACKELYTWTEIPSEVCFTVGFVQRDFTDLNFTGSLLYQTLSHKLITFPPPPRSYLLPSYIFYDPAELLQALIKTLVCSCECRGWRVTFWSYIISCATLDNQPSMRGSVKK